MCDGGQTYGPESPLSAGRIQERLLPPPQRGFVSKVREIVALRIAGSATRGIAALALFCAVQVADAVLTSAGMARYGVSIEANPLLLSAATTFGVGVTLVGAKLVAITGATILHVRSQHLVLAILTVIYVFAAILPWAWTGVI